MTLFGKKNDNMLSFEDVWEKPGDKVSTEDKLWWDRGCLWIHIGNDTMCLNSYEAAWLLRMMDIRRSEIWQVVFVDLKEGY